MDIDNSLRTRAAPSLAIAALLLLGACSSNPDEGASEPPDASEPVRGSEPAASEDGGSGGELSGDIVISGSSTVEPISSLVAEDFAGLNTGVEYSVDGPGTGDGFALFCDGETDISDASRTIREEEAAVCQENGVNYVELKIAIDGLSVITSTNNADVTCLSFGDLYALLGPESQGFESWTDANALADEIGADFGELHAPYPDVPLDVAAPGEESGTYDSFIEIALGDVAEARLEAGAITEDDVATTRADYQASADDNVIIENIAGSDSSLGWVGFAFADENADAVKLLEIDGGEGCVAPTPETIASTEYPISRDLFIYVNADRASESAALAAFVDYYLSDGGIAAAAEAGYVALAPDALDESRAAWEGR